MENIPDDVSEDFSEKKVKDLSANPPLTQLRE